MPPEPSGIVSAHNTSDVNVARVSLGSECRTGKREGWQIGRCSCLLLVEKKPYELAMASPTWPSRLLYSVCHVWRPADGNFCGDEKHGRTIPASSGNTAGTLLSL